MKAIFRLLPQMNIMKTLFAFIVLAVCLSVARAHAQTAMSTPVAWTQEWDVGVRTAEAIGVSIGPSNSIVQYCASCCRASLAQERTAPIDTAMSAWMHGVLLQNGWSVGQP